MSFDAFPLAIERGLDPERVAALAALAPTVIDRAPTGGLGASSTSVYALLRQGHPEEAAQFLGAFRRSPLHEHALRLFPDGYGFLVRNCAIRRHLPGDRSSRLGYHFDASFVGHRQPMVNFWVPLTPLGDGVPGLVFLAGPVTRERVWPAWQAWYDRRAAEAGAVAARSLSQIDDAAVRAAVGGDLAAHETAPRVAPGGALVFDERTLHRTETVTGRERSRLSLEFRLVGPDWRPPADGGRQVPVVDAVDRGDGVEFRMRAVDPP